MLYIEIVIVDGSGRNWTNILQIYNHKMVVIRRF